MARKHNPGKWWTQGSFYKATECEVAATAQQKTGQPLFNKIFPSNIGK